MHIKNPTALAYVATLPCETLMSEKQAINDKLQATHLRRGGVVNNQIKKGLLLILIFFTHTLSNEPFLIWLNLSVLTDVETTQICAVSMQFLT